MKFLSRAILATGVVLATPVFAQAPAAPDTPSPSEPVEHPQPTIDPEAKRILARAVEAIGGEQQREAIMSSRSVARLETTSGSTEFELLTMRPNKFFVRQRVEGLGQLEMGFDGKVGWRRDPPDGAISPLETDYVLAFGSRFDLQALIRNLDMQFTTQSVDEPVELDGIACDTVQLDDGKTVIIAYFARETGLPKALQIPNAREGSPPRRIIIEEWTSDARPLRWARKIRIEQSRQTMRAVYSSVTFDDVSASTFEPPVGLSKALQAGAVAE